METGNNSENKIKVRLNLHVKKRLQELTKEPTQDKNEPKDKTTTSPCLAPRAKRQKTKHVPKLTTSSNVTASSNVSTGIKSNELLLSPGAANSNDTTNSSINSTDQDGELNERDACDQTGSAEKSAKTGHRIDIFSCVLNQKKSSLMRDPEVITFLKSLMDSKK